MRRSAGRSSAPTLKPAARSGLARDLVPAGLSISERIRKGIALLAGDRLGESALSGMSLRENLFPNASNVAGGPFAPIDGRREASEASGVLGSVRRASAQLGGAH